jgi:hypothetical protein
MNGANVIEMVRPTEAEMKAMRIPAYGRPAAMHLARIDGAIERGTSWLTALSSTREPDGRWLDGDRVRWGEAYRAGDDLLQEVRRLRHTVREAVVDELERWGEPPWRVSQRVYDCEREWILTFGARP